MKKLVLCSSNPLLVKSLYGMLRDQGFLIEQVEHPARAVQRALSGSCDVMILDAGPFGLSAEDAARIIRSVAPELPILCSGSGGAADSLPLLRLPADLDAIKELMQHIAA